MKVVYLKGIESNKLRAKVRRFPSLVPRSLTPAFVACSTNAGVSTASNKRWGERPGNEARGFPCTVVENKGSIVQRPFCLQGRTALEYNYLFLISTFLTTPTQVWPYLLGLYPVTSTKRERATIDQRGSDAYHQALAEWKEVDRIQSIITERERVKRLSKRMVVPAPMMAPGGHQVNGVATEVLPSEPVPITTTDPSSSPVRSHSSSPSLYSISPSSTPERGRRLRVPSFTEPSLNEDAELNHSQMQTDLADQLQEHNTHTVPYASGIAIGPDDLQTNSIYFNSDSVDGAVSSSLGKVQNGPTHGPSEDRGESVNDVGGAELTILLEATAREEVLFSEPPTVPESQLVANGGGEGGDRESDPVDDGFGEEEFLDSKGQAFAEELFKIDKDIPRCDRDYW